MSLVATRISGVFINRLERVHDDRGAFARTFDAEEFAAAGIDPRVSQCSVSSNTRRGTLRGMHLQREPHGETKLIRCTAGAVFDVAVDVRPESATFGEWLGFDLTEVDDLAVVLMPGIAHGFITLTDSAEVTYQISAVYEPTAAVGFRWDDPAVGIVWPLTPVVMSERDRHLPLLAELESRMAG